MTGLPCTEKPLFQSRFVRFRISRAGQERASQSSILAQRHSKRRQAGQRSPARGSTPSNPFRGSSDPQAIRSHPVEYEWPAVIIDVRRSQPLGTTIMIAVRLKLWRSFWCATWKANLKNVCSGSPSDTAEAWKRWPEIFAGTLFGKKILPRPG
jgi:hypothetical protein